MKVRVLRKKGSVFRKKASVPSKQTIVYEKQTSVSVYMYSRTLRSLFCSSESSSSRTEICSEYTKSCDQMAPT